MKDAGVNSLAWSPAGLGPNGSCLLAVCTNSGHLNVYRAPNEPLAINWFQVCFRTHCFAGCHFLFQDRIHFFCMANHSPSTRACIRWTCLYFIRLPFCIWFAHLLSPFLFRFRMKSTRPGMKDWLWRVCVEFSSWNFYICTNLLIFLLFSAACWSKKGATRIAMGTLSGHVVIWGYSTDQFRSYVILTFFYFLLHYSYLYSLTFFHSHAHSPSDYILTFLSTRQIVTNGSITSLLWGLLIFSLGFHSCFSFSFSFCQTTTVWP